MSLTQTIPAQNLRTGDTIVGALRGLTIEYPVESVRVRGERVTVEIEQGEGTLPCHYRRNDPVRMRRA